MRKRPKKLTLHRETLRNLQTRELRNVAGGETEEIMTTCACSDPCGTGSCGCTGTCGCGGSQAACTTGQTYEILSGCATNC